MHDKGSIYWAISLCMYNLLLIVVRVRIKEDNKKMKPYIGCANDNKTEDVSDKGNIRSKDGENKSVYIFLYQFNCYECI